MAAASYGDGVTPRLVQLATAGDLDRVLGEVLSLLTPQGLPALTIDHGDGNMLTIATDGRRALLVHLVGTDGESYSSEGTATAGESFVFHYEGHWSEAPAETTVPLEDARDAVHAFLLTGKPTPSAVIFHKDS